MKTKLSLVLGGLFLLFQAGPVGAAITTFTVSATVPTATGVSITVASVNATTNVFTTMAAGTTALSFDPMTLNTTNNIYIPKVFYALNFGVANGAGTPDVSVTYTEGANPNGATNGLGFKSTATFAKEVTGATGATAETLLTAHGPKKRLIDLVGEHVTFTELTGGFLRIYLGVWTGSTVAPADPLTGKPFSNADAPGSYTGSLVVTSVVN
jgi:hypothetical protein